MIAVIAGASGLVGTQLLNQLLARTEFTSVIAVSRRPLGIESPKLHEVVVADFSGLHKYTQMLRGDHYYCCLGTTIKTAGNRAAFRRVDHDAVVEFGRVALKNGARSLSTVSAAGASPNSPFFYSRIKGEAEVKLSKLGLRELVIFKPGLLLGDRKEPRTGEQVAIHATKALESFLPQSWTRRIATPVGTLVTRMIEESLRGGQRVREILAKDI